MAIELKKINKFINEDEKCIEGYFFPKDMIACCLLGQIQQSKGVSGDLCEVGVYYGKSLVLLSLLKDEQERLIGYDLFDDNLLEKTKSNLEKYGTIQGVELIKGNSSNYTQEMLDTKLGRGLRLLHIDAGHEYHEVFQQLLQFAAYVKPGGIIIMDDYQDREFPGIEAAVLDFAEYDRPRRFVPFFSGGNKIYLCEPHLSHSYQKSLLQTEALRDQCRVSRVRDFNILIGFSKLPVSVEKCLSLIRTSQFPAYYSYDEQSLSVKSNRFQQISPARLKQV